MRRQPVQRLGGLADGFAQRRMRVDAHRQVLRRPPHFDGDDPFRDQFPRAGADQADAENLIGLSDRPGTFVKPLRCAPASRLGRRSPSGRRRP